MDQQEALVRVLTLEGQSSGAKFRKEEQKKHERNFNTERHDKQIKHRDASAKQVQRIYKKMIGSFYAEDCQ